MILVGDFKLWSFSLHFVIYSCPFEVPACKVLLPQYFTLVKYLRTCIYYKLVAEYE